MDTVLTMLFQMYGRMVRFAGQAGRQRLGRMVGTMLRMADARRRDITIENIRRALPELDARQHQDIMVGAYANLGITMSELLMVPWWTADDIRSLIRIPGIDGLRARSAQGLPNIVLSGHMGNWELLAMAGALHAETSFMIVVHRQKNAKADALLNSYRTRFGNRVVSMHEAAPTLVRVLRSGGTVAFLADQHANPHKDAWVDFFGRATPTYEAPAALALRYRAPIFVAFAERQADGSYDAPMRQLPMDDLEATPAGILELTRRHVQALETAVRRRPDLWSWQHRRWREEARP